METNKLRCFGVLQPENNELLQIHSKIQGYTQIVASSYVNNSIAVVHTVTTGKTMYLQTICGTASGSDAAGSLLCAVIDSVGTYQYTLFALNNWGLYGFPFSYNFPDYITIPSGYMIYINSTSATADLWITIFGYEK